MLTIAMRDLFARFTTTEDSSGERFGSTAAFIHVGSSTSAEVSSQNGVLGTSSERYIKAMDSGFPKRNDGTDSTGVNILAYRATFTTSEANFPWNEWGVKNTTASATSTTLGTLFNRKVDTTLGTKVNTQSWQFKALLTITT